MVPIGDDAVTGNGSMTKIGLGTLTFGSSASFGGTNVNNAGALNVQAGGVVINTSTYNSSLYNAGSGSTTVVASMLNPNLTLTLSNANITLVGHPSALLTSTGAWVINNSTTTVSATGGITTAGLVVGQIIDGVGIAPNTYITAISPGGTSFTLNKSPTGTATNTTRPLQFNGVSFTTNEAFNKTTLFSGASTVVVTNSGGGPANLALGTISRSAGSTLDFTLPSNGAVSTNVGTVNGILQGSGVSYATVNGVDWAARGSLGNNIVAGSSIPGFATLSTSNSLSGNADIASGINPITLAANATLTSLRFNLSETRLLNLNGKTLTTAGILDTVNGSGAWTISNGTVLGPSNTELVVIQNGSGTLTISAIIAGAGNGLTKSGSGTLVLSGNNTYSGVNTLNDGVVSFATGGLGSGAANTINFQGGTLRYESGNTFDVSSRIRPIGQYYNASIDPGSNTVAFSSALTGLGGLVKTGAAGTLRLNVANTYSGNTTISGGVLQAGIAGNVLPQGVNTGVLNFAGGGTFDLFGHSQAVNAITGSGGTISSSVAGAVTLTLGGNNASGAYNGTIQNGLGTVGVVKTGAIGLQAITGNQTYTGMTNVSKARWR